MATLHLSSVLFVLLLAHACTAAAASTLEDTCKSFASGDRTGHNYNYCMKTLGADPASANAADRVDIAMSAARATATRIAGLQRAETVPAWRACLDKCVAVYDVALGKFTTASRILRGGGSLWVAQTDLALVLGLPERCDRAFAEAGQRSPLSTADRQLDEAIKLALILFPPF